jgi:hypothetical protein
VDVALPAAWASFDTDSDLLDRAAD